MHCMLMWHSASGESVDVVLGELAKYLEKKEKYIQIYF